jgi:hypothetical protein
MTASSASTGADMTGMVRLLERLRKRGAPRRRKSSVRPARSTPPLTQGKSAISSPTQPAVGYQAVSKSKLAMTMYPSGGPARGPAST